MESLEEVHEIEELNEVEDDVYCVEMESLEEVHEIEELDEVENNNLEEDVGKFKNIEIEREVIGKPKIGMLFCSADEMFTYYKAYGKQEGFPVKLRTCKKGSDGIIRYVTFVCGRNGNSKSMYGNILKPQPIGKIGCHARLGGRVNKEGKWEIRTLDLEHNHGVSPNKTKYFRCNCFIDPRVKRQIINNDRAGIRVNKNYNSCVVEAGGHDNISFLERDCRNFVDKMRQLRLGEGDAIAMQTYFSKMQSKYEGFFFSMDLNEENRLRNVFWVDPRSKAAYNHFGDVVTFDTTYLTNKYDMPFAPFVGINHHGQSILLRCGLISSEDTETFIWLFRTWLVCMSEVAPIGIITDQDKEMKKAIKVVFPNTRHRWCLWHILKKVPEKLGAYNEYHSISSALHAVIYDSQSLDIFEDSWQTMILKFDLGNNKWLSDLYDERHRWVPCFVKNSFWAGMSTTQCSESINAFFDGFVNSKTSLKQFVEQYDNALKSKIENESLAYERSFSQHVPCVTIFEMEKQVQEVYTLSKFKEFQKELVGLMYCHILESVGKEYVVREIVDIANAKKMTLFKVVFEKDLGEVRCSCSMFEFKGIVCRHSVGVFTRNAIFVLPEKYILQRWRKDVRRSYSRCKMNYDAWNTTEEQERYDKMLTAFIEVASVASGCAESCNMILDWIKNTLNTIPKKGSSEAHQPTTICQGSVIINVENTTNILDPVATRKKGRPPYKRKESTICKKSKQKRKKMIASSTSVEESQGNIPFSGVVTEIATQESTVVPENAIHPFFTDSQHIPLPPQDTLMPCSNSWMTSGGIQYMNFQQLLLQQSKEKNCESKLPTDA